MKTDGIEAAARWLVDQIDPPRPIVANMAFIFKLTAKEAVTAIRRANDLRKEAGQKVPRYRPNRRRRRHRQHKENNS